MKTQKKDAPGRLYLKMCAEGANNGFVWMALSMMRLVSGRLPTRNGKSDKVSKNLKTDFSHNEKKQSDRNRDSGLNKSPGQKLANNLLLDWRLFGTLLERVEKILGRNTKVSGTAGHDIKRLIDDKTSCQAFRQLFDGNAEHRLAAVRWLRKQGAKDSVCLLESMLLIEDNNQVSEEISSVLKEIKNDKFQNT